MSFGIKTASGLQKIHSVRIKPSTAAKTITENGTYNAASDGADGYSAVTVNIPIRPAGNLIDPETSLINYELNVSDGSATPRSGGYVSNYIDVSGIAKIILYRKGNWSYSWFYDENKNAIQSSTSSGVIAIPERAYYIRTNDMLQYLNDDCIAALSFREEA